MVKVDWDPDERKLRQFGWIALVGFGVLAALAWFERGVFAGGLGEDRATWAGVLAGLGVASAVLSVVYPRANRFLFVALSVITYPIGFVLSYVILGFLYFGMFAPLALAFRLFGRDALRRRAGSKAGSYWTKARPERPKSDYFRQY